MEILRGSHWSSSTLTVRGSFLLFLASAIACGSVSNTTDPDGGQDLDAPSERDAAADGTNTDSDGGTLCTTSLIFNRSGDLHRINPDGTGLVNLTNSTSTESLPVFSPDGSRIAYRSNVLGVSDIFVANADGSNAIELTNLADDRPQLVRWISDSRVAFITDRSGNALDGDLVGVNLDGSGRLTIRPQPFPVIFLPFRTSPSTSKLAYLDASGAVKVIDANGANDTEVAALGSAPEFSPDGSKVAFNLSGDIFVVGVDGVGELNLTSNSADIETKPLWSTDGESIFFIRRASGADQGDIHVMNANGTGQTNLTVSAEPESKVAISPDGIRMAYSNGTSLVVANVDGSDATPITPIGGTPSISWRPCQD